MFELWPAAVIWAPRERHNSVNVHGLYDNTSAQKNVLTMCTARGCEEAEILARQSIFAQQL
jgi:hypothetical protein